MVYPFSSTLSGLGLLLLPLHAFDDIARHVEDPARRFPADEALWRFHVALEGASLAEVVLAPRDDGRLFALLPARAADETGEGQIVVLVLIGTLVFFRIGDAVRQLLQSLPLLSPFFFPFLARNAPSASDRTGRAVLRGYLFQFPSRLVVSSIVEELATVPERTEPGFLVVLADVWLVVESRTHADVGGASERPVCACRLLLSHTRLFLERLVHPPRHSATIRPLLALTVPSNSRRSPSGLDTSWQHHRSRPLQPLAASPAANCTTVQGSAEWEQPLTARLGRTLSRSPTDAWRLGPFRTAPTCRPRRRTPNPARASPASSRESALLSSARPSRRRSRLRRQDACADDVSASSA